MTVELLQALSIALLLLITLVGVVWAVVRERHMVHMHNQQTFALTDVDRTINDGTAAIRAGFTEITRQIEHSEMSSESKRQEIIRLILDSERRCMDTMRDLINNLRQQGMHVNFNRDAAGTQIGNGTNNQS